MTQDLVSREWSREERRRCCVSVSTECKCVRVACEGVVGGGSRIMDGHSADDRLSLR